MPKCPRGVDISVGTVSLNHHHIHLAFIIFVFSDLFFVKITIKKVVIMINANIIRLLQLVVPWFSIPFLPKKSYREFFPVTVVASILVTGMCSLAVPYKWWRVNGGLKEKVFNDGSFILGPFMVGTLWIFHFTFGNFLRYIIVNIVFDGLFAYPLNYLFERLRLYRLINFKPKHILGTFIGFALFIYGFQSMLQRYK